MWLDITPHNQRKDGNENNDDQERYKHFNPSNLIPEKFKKGGAKFAKINFREFLVNARIREIFKN